MTPKKPVATSLLAGQSSNPPGVQRAQDVVDLALAYQRNASMLAWLAQDQRRDPELLRGLERRALNQDLLRLAEARKENTRVAFK